MTFRQRRLLGWGILLAFAALGGLWLLRLYFAQKISTDFLDLKPECRCVVALGMIRALARAPAFAGPIALGDPTWRDGIGRELFEQRFALLFPTWLAGRDEANLAR